MLEFLIWPLSVRKQIKIRPGFTPQEDVKRFRGTRQTQMDANSLPKGHVIGWVPPAANTVTVAAPKANLSKAAKKNEKRKEKRKEKREAEKVKDSWEDEDEGDEEKPEASQADGETAQKSASGAPSSESIVDNLTQTLEKLDVR